MHNACVSEIPNDVHKYGHVYLQLQSHKWRLQLLEWDLQILRSVDDELPRLTGITGYGRQLGDVHIRSHSDRHDLRTVRLEQVRLDDGGCFRSGSRQRSGSDDHDDVGYSRSISCDQPVVRGVGDGKELCARLVQRTRDVTNFWVDTTRGDGRLHTIAADRKGGSTVVQDEAVDVDRDEIVQKFVNGYERRTQRRLTARRSSAAAIDEEDDVDGTGTDCGKAKQLKMNAINWQ